MSTMQTSEILTGETRVINRLVSYTAINDHHFTSMLCKEDLGAAQSRF